MHILIQLLVMVLVASGANAKNCANPSTCEYADFNSATPISVPNGKPIYISFKGVSPRNKCVGTTCSKFNYVLIARKRDNAAVELSTTNASTCYVSKSDWDKNPDLQNAKNAYANQLRTASGGTLSAEDQQKIDKLMAENSQRTINSQDTKKFNPNQFSNLVINEAAAELEQGIYDIYGKFMAYDEVDSACASASISSPDWVKVGHFSVGAIVKCSAFDDAHNNVQWPETISESFAEVGQNGAICHAGYEKRAADADPICLSREVSSAPGKKVCSDAELKVRLWCDATGQWKRDASSNPETEHGNYCATTCLNSLDATTSSIWAAKNSLGETNLSQFGNSCDSGKTVLNSNFAGVKRTCERDGWSAVSGGICEVEPLSCPALTDGENNVYWAKTLAGQFASVGVNSSACFGGYVKNTANVRLQCNADGTWKGTGSGGSFVAQTESGGHCYRQCTAGYLQGVVNGYQIAFYYQTNWPNASTGVYSLVQTTQNCAVSPASVWSSKNGALTIFSGGPGCPKNGIVESNIGAISNNFCYGTAGCSAGNTKTIAEGLAKLGITNSLGAGSLRLTGSMTRACTKDGWENYTTGGPTIISCPGGTYDAPTRTSWGNWQANSIALSMAAGCTPDPDGGGYVSRKCNKDGAWEAPKGHCLFCTANYDGSTSTMWQQAAINTTSSPSYNPSGYNYTRQCRSDGNWAAIVRLPF